MTSFQISANADATPHTHQIDEASLAQSFNTNLEVDAMVDFKIKRVSNLGTECTHKCYIKGIDVHVESDGRLTTEKNVGSGWVKYGDE